MTSFDIHLWVYMQVEIIRKNIKREKKTGRPHLKNLKNVFYLKKN